MSRMPQRTQSQQDVKRKLVKGKELHRKKSLRLERGNEEVDFNWLDELVDEDLEVDSDVEDIEKDLVETVCSKPHPNGSWLDKGHQQGPDSPGSDSLLSVDSNSSGESSLDSDDGLQELDLNDVLFSADDSMSKSEPTQNTTIAKQHYNLSAGIAYNQGLRNRMEDFATVVELSKYSPDVKQCVFAGVYDGHNGTEVSTLLAQHLHHSVTDNDYFASGNVAAALVHGINEMENRALNLVRQHLREQRMLSKSAQAQDTKRLLRTKRRTCTLKSTKGAQSKSIIPPAESKQLERVGSTAVVVICVRNMNPNPEACGALEAAEPSEYVKPVMASPDSRSPENHKIGGRIPNISPITSRPRHHKPNPTEAKPSPSQGTSYSKPPFPPNAKVLEQKQQLGTLFVAWVGDSRAVLCRENKPVALTRDHRASCPEERMRIESCGGVVDGNGRLYRDLALSRAVGNFFYKTSLSAREPSVLLDVTMKQTGNQVADGLKSISIGVNEGPDLKSTFISSTATEELPQSPLTHEPEVLAIPYTPLDKFVILASDGIWDTVNGQLAVDIVSQALNNGSSPQEAAEELIAVSVGHGSGDNKSVVVLLL